MVQKTASIAFRITAIYTVISVLWIVLSDRLLNYFVADLVLNMNIAILKGWFFVIITAGLLYNLISEHTKLLVESEKTLLKKNEEMMVTYEELLATEEELKQQFEELLCQEGKISRRNECLNALHEASLVLMQDSRADDLLATVVKKMMAMSNAQYGSVFLLDENEMLMKPKIINGFPAGEISKSVRQGQGVIGKTWESGQTFAINNYHEWEGRLQESIYELIRTSIGVPLITRGKVIGVFSMNYTSNHVFDHEDLQMLDSFAELASMVLGNSSLNEALQASQRRKQALIDALPDSIFQLDQQGVILDYKKGKDLPVLTAVKIGERIETILPPEASTIMMEKIKAALITDDTQVFEYQYWDHYQEVRIVVSAANEVIAISRDITKRKAMEHKLNYIALHDKITGLYNRAYFEEQLQELTSSSLVPIGIVICDIDGLKLVNDTFGHQMGDSLIISTGKVIVESVGDIGKVARVGGDEFAIIIENKDVRQIEEICQHIRERVKQFSEENIQMPMSISIGLSVRAHAAQSMYEVFKAADDNMYREKLHSSQSVRSSIVQTLGKALEARDFVTSGHADRLQYLIVELAMAVGTQEHRLSDLRLFGQFHDIGKVGIPDEILFKPGRLNIAEFEIMKRHCEIGYRIAQSSGDLAPIADWILKHQEWWNGEGYPLGVKGEEIPLACRILSIVDAYDAMTNDRPYRSAMLHDDALVEIKRCAGTQFDPTLVEVFKNIIVPDFFSLNEKYTTIEKNEEQSVS